MDKGKRIAKMRKFLELTQTQLATILETTQNIVSQIENGKYQLTEHQLDCLANKIYASRDWILYGDGQMFTQNTIPEFEFTRTQLDKIISNSNAVSSDSVPFIDKPIEGIYNPDDCQKPQYMVDYPPFNDCSFYRPMYGDSMSPKFKSGDVIACKKIASIEHIMYGEIYLCKYRSGSTMFETLRTIRRCDNPRLLILVPLNPNYDSTTIPKESIEELYIVKGKIERFI